jgi:hypothetical protein
MENESMRSQYKPDSLSAIYRDITINFQAELVALRGERDYWKDAYEAYRESAMESMGYIADRARKAEAQLVAREAPEDAWFAHKEYIASEVRKHCDESLDEIASFICFMERPPAKLAPSDDKEQP